MTTLTLLAEEITQDNLKNFLLGEKSYFLKKKNNCFFIMAYSEKIDYKRIKRMLDKISAKFFELYPIKRFKNICDYDTCDFSCFEKELKMIIEENNISVKRFWAGMGSKLIS